MAASAHDPETKNRMANLLTARAEAEFTDEVRTHTGNDGLAIKVIIPGGDAERLQDATLDYGDAQGLVIRNVIFGRGEPDANAAMQENTSGTCTVTIALPA